MAQFFDIVVHEESLRHKRGVSHTCGLEQNGVERPPLFVEEFEGLNRFNMDRTTEAAVHHLDHIFICALLLASDKISTASEYVVQQCGLARAKKTRQHCGRYAGVAVSGAAQIVLWTRSQHDLTATVKEAEGTRLRLDDVDLRPSSQPCRSRRRSVRCSAR